MHRVFAVLLIFAAVPCWGAKRVSAEQLERVLAGLEARRDADAAKQIGALEPVERISDTTLARLIREYSHGPQTADALRLLADKSSFLELPPSEVPAIAPPDAAMQEQQLAAAKRYALETLPRLPNLFATRTTYSFDNSPEEVKKGGWPEQAGLHLVGSTNAEVSIRNERDKLVRPASQPQGGLTTWGEFGSVLLLILSDSVHGTVRWSHWEQSAEGPVSVFHYEVPKSASHYEISTPVEQVTHMQGSQRWGGGRINQAGNTVPQGSDSSAAGMKHNRPGYHGSLWIDPATGTVRRISLVADLKGDSSLERAAIVVEYGAVHIGDQSYVCPVRSLALSGVFANVTATLKAATTEWLNEDLFTNYHLFGASARIVGETEVASEAAAVPREADAGSGAVANAPEEAAASAAPEKQPPQSASEASSPPASQGGEQPTPITEGAPAPVPGAGEVAGAPPPEPAPATEPAPAPASNAAGPGSPAVPAVSSPPSAAGAELTLHVHVDSVLIPVVVRDSNGNTIDDLEKQDFEVFDDGKSRPLSGFLIQKRGVARNDQQGAAATRATATQATSTQATAPTMALPDRVTVFVFDDMHLNDEQIAYAQKAVIGILDNALTGSDVAAVVTTSGRINSGLTRDKTKLRDAVMAVQPEGVYSSQVSECPKISYYEADLIVNKRDSAALADAIDQVMHVCSGAMPPQMLPLATSIAQSTARRALATGEQDLRTTYATITELVRRMAGLPGEHTMILISQGFLPIEEEARMMESRLINLAAESNVTIDALDARGLYTTALKAEDQVQNRDPVLMLNYRDNEMRGAGNAMGELADATGGMFFHNNNDLAAGFRMLLGAEETVYVLELPLKGIKQNGKWHRLSVRVDRARTQIEARHGYFAPEQ